MLFSTFFCVVEQNSVVLLCNILYNVTMPNINQQNTPSLEKATLIKHAQCVLDSRLTGVDIAKEIGVSREQIYSYRKGRRKIENAYTDTLLKFERVYQNHKTILEIERKK